MKIAILGGTGRQGSGLAMRWAKAGHQVIIGLNARGRTRDLDIRITGLEGQELV